MKYSKKIENKKPSKSPEKRVQKAKPKTKGQVKKPFAVPNDPKLLNNKNSLLSKTELNAEGKQLIGFLPCFHF